METGFSSLPMELFLAVLDQLVATRDGHRPVALAPSDPITKALRSLTLVSRNIYPVASKYLYTNCLYLGNSTNYQRFRRTLGLNLGNHPQALPWGQAHRNEELFTAADIPRHITSVFLSPHVTEQCGLVPRIRLPYFVDLCCTIGPTLRRLVMDFQPVYSPLSEVYRIKAFYERNSIFYNMRNLEELVCSYDTTEYFMHPPPNLKRLAITQDGLDDHLRQFVALSPNLRTVIVLRDLNLDAADLRRLLGLLPSGRTPPLEIVFVGLSKDQRTPEGGPEWTAEDTVTIWEIDVPMSYYGDEDELILCDNWIWEHAVLGTLFREEKRRMRSWPDLQREIDKVVTD